MTPWCLSLLGPGEAKVLKAFEFMILRFSSLKILSLCHLLTTVGDLAGWILPL